MDVPVTYHGVTCRARADMGRLCSCQAKLTRAPASIDGRGTLVAPGWYTPKEARRLLREYTMPDWMRTALAQGSASDTAAHVWEIAAVPRST